LPRRGPDGTIRGFQLWVNLPAAQKMSRPRYQEVASAGIPSVEANGVRMRIVAGEWGGVRGPVTEIAAQPLYMDVTLEPGADLQLPIPAGHTALAYLFEGEAVFGPDQAAGQYAATTMLVFSAGDSLHVRSGDSAGARFMLMAGAPFHEPIVPYGPFVMNTEEEIRQALMDLRAGRFVQPEGAAPSGER
jgi:redox-sensitive bicupin YhaK (pirin superfamily)